MIFAPGQLIPKLKNWHPQFIFQGPYLEFYSLAVWFGKKLSRLYHGPATEHNRKSYYGGFTKLTRTAIFLDRLLCLIIAVGD